MIVSIKAKVHARENAVERIDDTTFIVHTTEAPEKGKANRAIMKLVAEHLDIPASRIRIVRGIASQKKLLEIV